MRESWINNPIRVTKVALVAVDIGALIAVIAIELWRTGSSLGTFDDRWVAFLPFGALLLLFPSLLFALGLYDHLETAPRTRHPMTLVVTVALWAGAVNLALVGTYNTPPLWPASLIIGAAIGGVLWVLRSVAMRPTRFDRGRVGVLFLGWDRSIELLTEVLRTHPYRRRSIVGILAPSPGDADLPRPDPDLRIPEFQVHEARAVLSQGRVGELVVPVAQEISVAALQLVRERPHHVRIHSALSIYEGLVHKVPISVMGDQALEPTVRLRMPRHGRIWQNLHRTMDVLVAGLLLLVLWPLLLSVAIVSFVVQGMPIIFAQERVGLGGRLFTIFKFRTMKVLNRSRAESELMTTIGDARLTDWGRILRRLHLDELPQLWNILRGDMSLIGPRPISKELDMHISSRMPFWDLRYLVHPGATGWEQVCSGDSRNEIGQCERLERDLYYIEHASVMLDIYILLKTPGVLLRRRGAR
jgi:lipopolysaccharide/colanic/teichoic acid biosynthesis glycosyltransferase